MPHRILIADSDRGVSAAIAQGLRDAGYEVLTAADGDDAAKKVAAGGIDLVCLDVGLPPTGAFDVYPRLREAKAIPVILMCERLDDRTCAGIAATGAEDLLFKPLDLIEVIDKAAWYLEDYQTGE